MEAFARYLPNIFQLIGGIAFFLYGMRTLSDGLGRVGGGKFESALETMTSNPISGVLLGAVITALIQSSGATTVMVVGFVNSGVMSLMQAVGIIMGANLGTTATAWLLSLANLGDDSVVVQLLSPKNFGLLLALIGVIMIMVMKRGKKRDIGRLFVGFGLLMNSMTMMSGAVAPLTESDFFKNLIVLFSQWPILGLFVGIVMTVILQSSAAAVGIVQALSITGLINFGTVIPIILGQNIGTCMHAMLSGVGAKKNAKRAAAIHLYFNVIGSLLFLIALYVVRGIGWSLLETTVDSTKIAIFHTVFNTATILLLLPLRKLLVKLATLTYPDKPEEGESFAVLLDDRFLKAPSIAVEQCVRVVNDMAKLSFGTLEKSIGLLEQFDEKVGEEITSNEEMVDQYEDKLGSYLVKLNEASFSAKEKHTVSSILMIISDLERVSDHAVNLLEAAQEMHDKKIVFSDSAQKEMENMIAAIREIMQMTLESYTSHNADKASYVEPLEEVIDMMKDLMKANHIKRVVSNQCTIDIGFVFNDILTNFERVSDHCSNIALSVMSDSTNTYEGHEYVKEVEKHSEFYADRCEEYKKKYYLSLI